MDGALYESVIQHMVARHELFYADGAPGDVACRFLLQNTDWTMGVKCNMHACSNGIKWALIPWGAEELKDDTHIVIASLRNSSCVLQEHIGDVLQRCLRFREQAVAAEDCLEFWSAIRAICLRMETCGRRLS